MKSTSDQGRAVVGAIMCKDFGFDPEESGDMRLFDFVV
jgi:hypothetical protein